MATSDSDDFESADEEIEFRDPPVRSSRQERPPNRINSFVDSDSGDDDQCASDSEEKTWNSNTSASYRPRTAVQGGKNLSDELRESEQSKSSKPSSQALDPSNTFNDPKTKKSKAPLEHKVGSDDKKGEIEGNDSSSGNGDSKSIGQSADERESVLGDGIKEG